MIEYLQLASRGENAWWRYLLCPIAAFGLAILLVAGVTIALLLMGLVPADLASQIQQPRHILPFYLGIAAIFGSLVIGFLLSAFFIHRKRPGDIMGRWRWSFFVVGFGIWLAIQIVLVLTDFLIAPRGFAVSAGRQTLVLACAALLGIAVQTIGEEVIFRGYATQGFLLIFRKPLVAAIVSGLFFGAVHIMNGIPQALNATVFGIVCALLTIRTGSIALTSGLHLSNNYFGAVLVVSGGDVFKGSPGIFTQTTPHLMWWDLCLSVAALVGVTWLFFRRPYFSATSAA